MFEIIIDMCHSYIRGIFLYDHGINAIRHHIFSLSIGPSRKSQNASDKQHTIRHFATKMCTDVITSMLQNGALQDWCFVGPVQ